LLGGVQTSFASSFNHSTMKKREPVSHIMTTHVHSIREEDQLEDAVAVFRKHKIRHLPVVKGNHVVGILSSTDINRLSFGRLFDNQDGADAAVLHALTIPQVMTSKPRTVPSEMSIREVAEILATDDFHALPVVDGGELKGIVTTTDILKYMLEQY
jgi:CBS domain-containing protein